MQETDYLNALERVHTAPCALIVAAAPATPTAQHAPLLYTNDAGASALQAAGVSDPSCCELLLPSWIPSHSGGGEEAQRQASSSGTSSSWAVVTDKVWQPAAQAQPLSVQRALTCAVRAPNGEASLGGSQHFTPCYWQPPPSTPAACDMRTDAAAPRAVLHTLHPPCAPSPSSHSSRMLPQQLPQVLQWGPPCCLTNGAGRMMARSAGQASRMSQRSSCRGRRMCRQRRMQCGSRRMQCAASSSTAAWATRWGWVVGLNGATAPAAELQVHGQGAEVHA